MAKLEVTSIIFLLAVFPFMLAAPVHETSQSWVTDGERYIKELYYGEKREKPKYLLFTAPYKLCAAGNECKQNNLAFSFPLYVGKEAIESYKTQYKQDYKDELAKHPDAKNLPFKKRTQRTSPSSPPVIYKEVEVVVTQTCETTTETTTTTTSTTTTTPSTTTTEESTTTECYFSDEITTTEDYFSEEMTTEFCTTTRCPKICPKIEPGSCRPICKPAKPETCRAIPAECGCTPKKCRSLGTLIEEDSDYYW